MDFVERYNKEVNAVSRRKKKKEKSLSKCSHGKFDTEQERKVSTRLFHLRGVC